MLPQAQRQAGAGGRRGQQAVDDQRQGDRPGHRPHLPVPVDLGRGEHAAHTGQRLQPPQPEQAEAGAPAVHEHRGDPRGDGRAHAADQRPDLRVAQLREPDQGREHQQPEEPRAAVHEDAQPDRGLLPGAPAVAPARVPGLDHVAAGAAHRDAVVEEVADVGQPQRPQVRHRHRRRPQQAPPAVRAHRDRDRREQQAQQQQRGVGLGEQVEEARFHRAVGGDPAPPADGPGDVREPRARDQQPEGVAEPGPPLWLGLGRGHLRGIGRTPTLTLSAA